DTLPSLLRQDTRPVPRAPFRPPRYLHKLKNVRLEWHPDPRGCGQQRSLVARIQQNVCWQEAHCPRHLPAPQGRRKLPVRAPRQGHSPDARVSDAPAPSKRLQEARSLPHDIQEGLPPRRHHAVAVQARLRSGGARQQRHGRHHDPGIFLRIILLVFRGGLHLLLFGRVLRRRAFLSPVLAVLLHHHRGGAYLHRGGGRRRVRSAGRGLPRARLLRQRPLLPPRPIPSGRHHIRRGGLGLPPHDGLGRPHLNAVSVAALARVYSRLRVRVSKRCRVFISPVWKQ
ncbi:hypothetical protein T484DRAFT_1885808, partial [Baffinella frigidus]